MEEVVKVIIIDDELASRESLKVALTESTLRFKILGEACSAIKGIDMINKSKPDLVFLDIEMPGGCGFEMLKNLDKINFEVVFTTAYQHYALKAIKVAALDYLLKPISVKDLEECFLRFSKKGDRRIGEKIEVLEQNFKPGYFKLEKLAIPSVEGFDIVDISDIVYCEADKNYTQIYLLSKNKVLSSKTLKEYEVLLPNEYFLRVHQKYLVNLKHLKKYTRGRGGIVKMINGKEIEVSRNRKMDLLALLK